MKYNKKIIIEEKWKEKEENSIDGLTATVANKTGRAEHPIIAMYIITEQGASERIPKYL